MNTLKIVNVRKLADYVTDSVKTYLGYFVFDPKDNITKDTIKAGIQNYLEELKENRAINQYSVDVGNSESERELDWVEMVLGRNDDNQDLNIVLQFQPTRTVETIKIQFVVT